MNTFGISADEIYLKAFNRARQNASEQTRIPPVRHQPVILPKRSTPLGVEMRMARSQRQVIAYPREDAQLRRGNSRRRSYAIKLPRETGNAQRQLDDEKAGPSAVELKVCPLKMDVRLGMYADLVQTPSLLEKQLGLVTAEP